MESRVARLGDGFRLVFLRKRACGFYRGYSVQRYIGLLDSYLLNRDIFMNSLHVGHIYVYLIHLFSKISFRNTTTVLYNVDPDQA